MINNKSYQKERIAILVVAYYNLGVEMEFLKKVIQFIFKSKDLEAKKIFTSAL